MTEILTKEEFEKLVDDYGEATSAVVSWYAMGSGDYDEIDPYTKRSRVLAAYSELSAYAAKLESVCKQFVGFYPQGINPYLDTAQNEAREVLKTNGEREHDT